MLGNMLASLAGVLAASTGAAHVEVSAAVPKSFGYGPGRMGRDRSPGRRRPAGTKLLRMAREGRLGRGQPR